MIDESDTSAFMEESLWIAVERKFMYLNDPRNDCIL
jgi:hypothetical protein